MSFWADAFKWGWADADLIRMVVITDDFPWGEITKEEFEEITGQPFDPIVDPPAEPEPEPETPPEDQTPKN